MVIHYHIINVPPYDECAFASSITDGFIQLEDEDGDQVAIILRKIDLNDPQVHVYNLVLTNPKN